MQMRIFIFFLEPLHLSQRSEVARFAALSCSLRLMGGARSASAQQRTRRLRRAISGCRRSTGVAARQLPALAGGHWALCLGSTGMAGDGVLLRRHRKRRVRGSADGDANGCFRIRGVPACVRRGFKGEGSPQVGEGSRVTAIQMPSAKGTTSWNTTPKFSWNGFLPDGNGVYWMRTMLPFGSICTRSPTRMALASGTVTLL